MASICGWVGPFLGFETGGKGTFSFEMFKTKEDKIILATKSDFKHFSFENYNLDILKANVDFLISDDTIDIKKINGASGKNIFKCQVKL